MKKYDKTLACWGFWGQRNVGDDLILCELYEHIISVLPEAKIILSCDEKEATRLIGNKSNIFPVGRNPIVFLRKSLHADLIICGPGGLFPFKNTKKLIYWLIVSAVTKVRRAKIIFLGIGIGNQNFNSAINRWILRRIIAMSEAFITRQEGVKKALNTNNSKVLESADVIFSKKKIFIEKTKDEDKNVVVALANIFENDLNEEDIFIKNLAPSIINLIENGYKVKLMTFTDKKDTELNLRLFDYIGKPFNYAIELIPYLCDTNENINIIAKSDICIAMRFHALVISLCYGIPCCTIAYSDKLEDIANRIGVSDYLVKVSMRKNKYYKKYIPLNSEEMLNKIVHLQINCNEINKNVNKNIEKYIKLSQATWNALENILGKLF